MALVIQQNRMKLALLALGSLLLAATCFWVGTLPYGQVGLKGEFAAYVGVPFFGVCGLFALYKLRDKRPLLVVDEYGIHDNSSALGVGLIRWSQINGFSRAEVKGEGMLAIHVSDPETLISAASPLKRPALRANLAMYGTPVFLSEFLLGLTSAQLLAAIKQYWRPEMSGSLK